MCNLAVSGTHGPVVSGDLAQRKLFIGGLSYETTTETLISIFSQYGAIEEGSVAYDKSTNKSRYIPDVLVLPVKCPGFFCRTNAGISNMPFL